MEKKKSELVSLFSSVPTKQGLILTEVAEGFEKTQEMLFKEAEVSKKLFTGENELAKLVVPEMSQMVKVPPVAVAETPPAFVTFTLQV